MIPFLKSVAYAYKDNYTDLSEVCFVFPNKRSGTFFTKYLTDVSNGKAFVAPHITTISDLVSDMSRLIIDSKIDLLFTLYSIYRDMQQTDVEFDKFRTWGEMVLADFNDVEMYMVDSEQLFKNLSDLKKIESNYLTDEQLEVIRDYFGITDYENDRKSFWSQFSSNNISDNKRKFLKLWEILSPLRSKLIENLEQRGLAFNGMAYRRALDNLREKGTSILPYKRIVMVGFNALSTVEWNIFKELKKLKIKRGAKEEPFADFYWNCTGTPMEDESNNATHFVRKDIDMFESIYDISSSDVDGMPEVMRAIAAPSNVGQVKIVAKLLKELKTKIAKNGDKETDIAVVLPDEELVIPMIYSLPEVFESVNLTMGYPLRTTMAATFIGLIRRLQMRKRTQNGIQKFFHEDVKALLMHPYTANLIAANELNSIYDNISKLKKYMMSLDDMAITNDKLLYIFRYIDNDAGVGAITDYLITNMNNAAEAISDMQVQNDLVHKALDIPHIKAYCNALQRLKTAAEKYEIKLSAADIFSLIDKLIGGESVRFVGKPLKGIQIIGPLEARCLDFKYLIILSMNERIYPRKLVNRSFIPAILHHGYGMPTTRFQESIFAYNFYSMISRSKEVYMIYDARTEGMKSGDMSRYIRQLQHLYAPEKISFSNFRFGLNKSDSEKIIIKKTESVMADINKYFTPGTGKHFSASSLKSYLECPLKFYLLNVHGLNEPQEPKDFMGSDILGTIVHAVMEEIYKQLGWKYRDDFLCHPLVVTQAKIEDIMNDKDVLMDIIYKKINDYYSSEESSEIDLYADSIYQIIYRTLQHDKNNTPFDYYGSEIKVVDTYPLDDGSSANVKYVIDRIDSCGPKKYRIVDYKTGVYKMEINEMEDILDPKTGAKTLFQLFFYATILNMQYNLNEDISVEIYDMQKDMNIIDEKNPRTPQIAKDKAFDLSNYLPDYEDILNELIKEIKNPEVPIVQTENPDSCTYCPFKQTICNI